MVLVHEICVIGTHVYKSRTSRELGLIYINIPGDASIFRGLWSQQLFKMCESLSSGQYQPMTNQPMTNQAMSNQPMTNQAMSNQPMTKQAMSKGLFTVRRNPSLFWSGTLTDMIIEQSLMRAGKTSGGLINTTLMKLQELNGCFHPIF